MDENRLKLAVVQHKTEARIEFTQLADRFRHNLGIPV
jgi:hypothetical protein